MPAGDVYEFTTFCKHAEQVSVMRRYYETITPTGTEATQAQMVANLEAVFAPLLKACMSNEARFEGATIAQIWPLPRKRASQSTVLNGIGTNAFDLLPRQVRGIITLRTFNAGKKFRGRVYAPFPSENFNVPGGIPAGTYVAALDALGAALIADRLTGTSPNQTLLRPRLTRIAYTGTPPNRVMIQPVLTAYEGFLSRPRWATQRRSGSYGRPDVLPF